MDHNQVRFKSYRSDSMIYHDEEEKQIIEEPVHTSEQSEAPNPIPLKPPPPPNKSPPPAAFSQNYTYVPPQQFYQPPLHASSSKPTAASPKTHFYFNQLDQNKDDDAIFIKVRNNDDEVQIKHELIPKPKAVHHKTHSHPIKKHIKDDIMKHPIAQNLVIMGFNENHVERACKIFKKNFPSKPLRLEVLTEIIIRLQTKDAQNKHQRGYQSMDLELYKAKEQPKKVSLKQSGTVLIDNKNMMDNLSKQKRFPAINYVNAINHNINNINNIIKHNQININMDHDINSLNIKGAKHNDNDDDKKEEDPLVLVEISISSSISSRSEKRRCEIRINSSRTLFDLKRMMITMLNNKKYDCDKENYVFYHNESGLIFNDDSQTINECFTDIDDGNNILSLKVGRLKVASRVPPMQRPRSVASPPQSPKKRPSSAVPHRPLPPQRPSSSMDRRSTKIAVMNNKITVERHKSVSFREILGYIKDSPFWWKKLNLGIERVRKLTLRLKSIASLISSLCSLLRKFSAHCSKISSDVMKSWVDIENEFAGDMLSLNAQFFNLGETIEALSSSSNMLSMTLTTVIVDEFNKFCDYHFSTLLQCNKELIQMKNEYEMSLSSILHNNNNNNNNNISRKCESLRKEYELKRYDQCLLLNSIINKNRYDIILTLCAAFSAFETFFHIGYESAMSFKDVHNSIRMGIPDKISKQQIYIETVLNKNRDILIDVLNEGKDYNHYKRSIRKKPIVMGNIDENIKDQKRFKHVSLDYYDGYLWKQSSKSKKKWQKRWFVLTNGELEYFRSAKEEKHKTKSGKEYIGNTALCKVKKASSHEYKFVLQIITPSQRVYVLQAQTKNEYDEWFYVLENQCARLLLRKNTIELFKSATTKPNECETLKHSIFTLNRSCADCNESSPTPSWCCINIGVVICVNCCGVHRELGSHVSKMRSLELDNLSIITLKCIVNCGGNDKLNKELLEYNLNIFDENDLKKIDYRNCTQNERSNFIKNKYCFKMFSANQSQTNQNDKLWNAVTNNDCFAVVESLYYGADINHQFQRENNKTVLHQAVKRNYTNIVQLLINNDAQIRIEDGNEQIPNQIAIQQSLNNNVDSTQIQQIFKNAVYY